MSSLQRPKPISSAIHYGDCRAVMQSMRAETIDAIITDPPYGLSFLGKEWDHSVPGFVFWREALRVAKPGAHLLAFGGTRTFHRLTCAIEDAGWKIRDCVMWVYASGFPKSLDISKAIDNMAGAEREIIGRGKQGMRIHATWGTIGQGGMFRDHTCRYDITAPATEDAKRWEGWGTALKPAWEPIVMACKPPAASLAENVMEYWTGGLNIGACRIAGKPIVYKHGCGGGKNIENRMMGGNVKHDTEFRSRPRVYDKGRWPSNIIHDGSAEVCEALGGASRFFYCPKVSIADREEGCEALPRLTAGEMTGGRNYHPTVKPTALMRYLCKLITPPNGIILDPFTGSGSTGKAAILEGFRFVGIEKEMEYCQIAEARIAEARIARTRAF